MRLPWQQPADHHLRLAERARRGDREAFVALYRALYPPVARFVGRRVTCRADAEDAVARTFHRLLELRFGDGLRHAEIAALTGGTEVGVRQRLRRALAGLRATLAGAGGLAP